MSKNTKKTKTLDIFRKKELQGSCPKRCATPIVPNMYGLHSSKILKLSDFKYEKIAVINKLGINIVCNEILIPFDLGVIVLDLKDYNGYTLYLIDKFITNKELSIVDYVIN